MRDVITLSTERREILVAITAQVRALVARSGVRDGLVSVCAQGATCGMMIQEKLGRQRPDRCHRPAS